MATQNKFDIEHFTKDDQIVRALRSMIKSDTFDLEAIAKRKWMIGLIDDNNIFDTDCVRLCESMLSMQSHHFFISSIDDLLNKNIVTTLKYPTKVKSIEHFQSNINSIDNKVFRYEDCIFFDKKLSWAIIRTGEISYTAFSGPPRFVLPILGLKGK